MFALQEREFSNRIKEMKKQEGMLSLSFILSSYDLSEEEIQQVVMALKSQEQEKM
jgi:hypothetical protein